MPRAPEPQPSATRSTYGPAASKQAPSASPIQNPPPNAPPPTAGAGSVRLTLADADRLALRNNPRIAVGRLLALAQDQVTRETRSVEMPTMTGNLTAVDSHQGSRITAGALNNPIVYQRAAGGVTLSQLITDFGRTRNLVSSAELTARAEASAADATAADITLAVDEAFYRALGAQSVLNVANETVSARQTSVDQITALTNAKLRSTLDLSFANVALAQAKLLLLNAKNESQDAMTTLNALLGEEGAPNFVLVEDATALPPPPEDPEALVGVAFRHRPDLLSLSERATAAAKFSAAEHDLNRPTISALGTAGGSPIRSDQITSSWYGAAGVNLSIPIFNGFLFSARAQEADLRSRAAQEQVKDLRDAIARDVRTTALQAQSNFQRIAVAQQLLEQANSALDLAQTRYNLGLSSIVELSQAQLAQTQAQIDLADARYAYAGSLANIRFQTGQ
ncbi:MAG TPA: TolC family protein [Acidobacteriaceae bacterium]|nr:TolC family protein [Acidobacteriaceae bacterium]